MEEKKKSGKGGLVVIIVLLLLICCGMGAFIFMNKDKIFTKEAVKEEKVTKEENTSSDYIYVFDESKIQEKGNTLYSVGGAAGLTGTSYMINEENPKEVKVEVSWGAIYNEGTFGSVWAEQNVAKKDKVDSFKLTFDKKVIDMYYASFGLDFTESKMIFIMEDGSLQYLADYDAVKNSKFDDVKKLDIEKVVKFYESTSQEKGSHIGGHITTLAQTMDGKIYDLEKLMK